MYFLLGELGTRKKYTVFPELVSWLEEDCQLELTFRLHTPGHIYWEAGHIYFRGVLQMSRTFSVNEASSVHFKGTP